MASFDERVKAADYRSTPKYNILMPILLPHKIVSVTDAGVVMLLDRWS